MCEEEEEQDHEQVHPSGDDQEYDKYDREHDKYNKYDKKHDKV